MLKKLDNKNIYTYIQTYVPVCTGIRIIQLCAKKVLSKIKPPTIDAKGLH